MSDISLDRVLAETRHVRLVDRNGWQFVQRTTYTGIVCIIPVTTEREVVLIEQYRPPVRQRVIELPAGLAGDTAAQAGESLEDAARRELLEETGYRAAALRQLSTMASSPGLTDETFTFFLAERAEKVAAGGGDGSENIQVHLVPLDGVDAWLQSAGAEGKLVDARVYSGLYLLWTFGA